MNLDSLDEETRLLALMEGVLAANIFDWGSQASIEIYHKGTIIEIYRMSHKKCNVHACQILKQALEAGGLLNSAATNEKADRQICNNVPPLMILGNGCGGPCLDLRQVSLELAAAAKSADLIILEGMGRALHTDFNARFKCEALKLAMVKN